MRRGKSNKLIPSFYEIFVEFLTFKISNFSFLFFDSDIL